MDDDQDVRRQPVDHFEDRGVIRHCERHDVARGEVRRRRRAFDPRRVRPPGLFALYVAYYCFGRFFEELLRVDPAHELAGLRLNAWVSIVVFVCATAFFVWWQVLGRGGDPHEPRRARARPPTPRGPKMAIPKSRVR